MVRLGPTGHVIRGWPVFFRMVMVEYDDLEDFDERIKSLVLAYKTRLVPSMMLMRKIEGFRQCRLSGYMEFLHLLKRSLDDRIDADVRHFCELNAGSLAYSLCATMCACKGARVEKVRVKMQRCVDDYTDVVQDTFYNLLDDNFVGWLPRIKTQLAIAMALHPRLGEVSPMRALSGDLARVVAEQL